MWQGRAVQAAWLAITGALSTVVLLVTPSLVLAQATGTATIRGTVEDTSGGGVPNATVTLTNTGTNAVATAVTDGRGGYQFIVFPGTYSIKVELTGFKGRIEFDPSKPNGQPRRCLDVSRAEREIGFRAKTDFRTGLRETISWYEHSREKVS